MTLKSASNSAYHWELENVSAELLRRVADVSTRVRYEDFAVKPSEVFQALLREMQLDAPMVGEEEVKAPLNHAVLGNPTFYNDGNSKGLGNITIKLDDEWKSRMAQSDKLKVTLITSLLLIKYGYLPNRR